MARTCTKLLKIWIVMAGRPFDSGSDYSVDSRFFYILWWALIDFVDPLQGCL
jgi:hypothetical protein